MNIRSGAFACLICVQDLSPNKFGIVAGEESPCGHHARRGAANALVVDRLFEVVLVVIEAGIARRSRE